MRAERDEVREQQQGDLLFERHVGEQYGLRQLGLRDGIVHRQLRAGVDSMLGSGRISDLFRQWHVGVAQRLYESSVPERVVHGRVHARRDALLQQQHADV